MRIRVYPKPLTGKTEEIIDVSDFVETVPEEHQEYHLSRIADKWMDNNYGAGYEILPEETQ